MVKGIAAVIFVVLAAAVIIAAIAPEVAQAVSPEMGKALFFLVGALICLIIGCVAFSFSANMGRVMPLLIVGWASILFMLGFIVLALEAFWDAIQITTKGLGF